jgi:hypothetical protein
MDVDMDESDDEDFGSELNTVDEMEEGQEE